MLVCAAGATVKSDHHQGIRLCGGASGFGHSAAVLRPLLEGWSTEGAVRDTCPHAVQGVGLCHGVAGNGYALLCHARDTGEALGYRRAVQFALFAAQHWRELYAALDAPASLFEMGSTNPGFVRTHGRSPVRGH